MQCGQIFRRTSVHLHDHQAAKGSNSTISVKTTLERIFFVEEVETNQELYKKLSQETLSSEFTLLK
uniref:Uncharacterized protein n=1 Tax=Lepeophtheirus salmonis TaxID=72036 RepID=A0A0K2ULB3_LEPSM